MVTRVLGEIIYFSKNNCQPKYVLKTSLKTDQNHYRLVKTCNISGFINRTLLPDNSGGSRDDHDRGMLVNKNILPLLPVSLPPPLWLPLQSPTILISPPPHLSCCLPFLSLFNSLLPSTSLPYSPLPFPWKLTVLTAGQIL